MSVTAAAVAAWGLPTAHHLPERPLADDAFDELLAECTRHRTLGLLGGAVRVGDLPVTSAQHDAVEARWQEWLGHALRAERTALAVTEVLAEAGLPARVLKGVALARSSYPDPETRVYGDLDLLVPAASLHRAGAVLVDVLGGTRAEPEVRPGFDDRFARELLVRVDDLEVDLHRTLANGAFGVRIPLATLFDDPVTVAVGGRALAILPPIPRLLHAAYQSTLADWPPRLVAFRDVAQILTHDAPDADAVVTTARAWGGTAVLAEGLTRAWRALRCTTRPALVDWAERNHAHAYDRFLVAATQGRARGYTAGLTTLLALPGVRRRAAYLHAVLVPSAEYRAARGLGRAALFGAAA